MTGTSAQLGPVLTPNGRLTLASVDDGTALPADLSQRLQDAFARGSGHGLLQLGAEEVGTVLPPVLGYWREFAARYVTTLCTHPDITDGRAPDRVPLPPDHEIESLAGGAPPMTGAEYLTASVLHTLWDELDTAFHAELSESKASVQDFLAKKSRAWRLVGRVHFNLAENKKDDAAPFAFMATYTTRLSAHAKAQHLPLGQALREYAGAAQKAQLLSLLLPVQRAAEQCAWLKRMVDAGEIYHPLRWTPADAFQLLTDLPRLEASGVVVRVPGTWRANRPARPQVSATVGGKAPSGLGADALLDFHMEVTLDGERLTAAEIKQLLAASDGLHFVRGRWVELDREKLGRLLEQFRAVEQTAAAGGLTFAEAMRLVAGANVSGEGVADAAPDWSRIVAGPWLANTLDGLRRPDALARVDPGEALKTTLRPYQQVGVRWLHLLSTLGLGACLADDMGLGKTIQVLALMLAPGTDEGSGRRTSLLVAPASLLANWSSEIARFAPSLRTLVAHPSAMPAAQLQVARSDGIRERRSRHHELRIAAAGPRPDGDAVAPGRARRGAGHQESRRPADARGQAARRARAHRADGHAGREPARGSLVDLRFHQPRAARIEQGVHDLHQASRGETAESVRATARAGPAVYPQTAEDRQDRHRRPAGQDRGEGLLPSDAHAGGALSAGRERAVRRAEQSRRDRRAGASCWRR